MVRLIGLLLVWAMLYLYTLKLDKPNPVQKVPGQSIITVEELPPVREENR